jgi:site-specific recombinase XerD
MTPLRRRMIEDMRVRNFAPGTQSTYVRHLARFAQHFGKSPEFLGLEELRAYQVYLVQEKQVSWSIFNTVVCALRFLYRITLSRDWLIQQIPFPRREKKLPVILSLSEVERFLQAIPNVKHRAILMTAYAAGLRVSEVASLHVTDIDSQRMVIRIQQGKGRKDRLWVVAHKAEKSFRSLSTSDQLAQTSTRLWKGAVERNRSPIYGYSIERSVRPVGWQARRFSAAVQGEEGNGTRSVVLDDSSGPASASKCRAAGHLS